MDAYKNFAVSSVVIPPSPALSGTTLTVQASHGLRFPAVPFNLTVYQRNAIPDPLTAEIVRVTAIVGDTLTIVRTQEASLPRSILFGDLVGATITKKLIDELAAPSAASDVVVREIPTGVIDGVNTVFTLTNTPLTDSEQIFLNGLLQDARGVDYSISSTTVTFLSPPISGDRILVTYQRI
jgi:hypothetical protein